MSLFKDAEDAFVDHAADSVVNDIIPGGSGKCHVLYNDAWIYVRMLTGLIGGTVQTGVDQALNNDINRDLGGGLGSSGGGGGGIFWSTIYLNYTLTNTDISSYSYN